MLSQSGAQPDARPVQERGRVTGRLPGAAYSSIPARGRTGFQGCLREYAAGAAVAVDDGTARQALGLPTTMTKPYSRRGTGSYRKRGKSHQVRIVVDGKTRVLAARR